MKIIGYMEIRALEAWKVGKYVEVMRWIPNFRQMWGWGARNSVTAVQMSHRYSHYLLQLLLLT